MMPHLRMLGKGNKVRYVPAHPLSLERIHDYLQTAGHGEDADGPLFEALEEPGGGGAHRLSRSPMRPFLGGCISPRKGSIQDHGAKAAWSFDPAFSQFRMEHLPAAAEDVKRNIKCNSVSAICN